MTICAHAGLYTLPITDLILGRSILVRCPDCGAYKIVAWDQYQGALAALRKEGATGGPVAAA